MKHLLAILVTCFLVLSGCGIPLDTEPTVIASEDLPDALQPEIIVETTLPILQSDLVTIYLVEVEEGDSRLVPVARQIPETDADRERAALEQLLAGPTSEEQLEDNLTTFVVPSGDEPIQVLDLQRPSTNLISVVLSEPPAIEGGERVTSFAQIVFTLTESPEIDLVRFLVRNDDGVDEFITVKTDTEEGDVNSSVGRSDYTSLDPADRPTG